MVYITKVRLSPGGTGHQHITDVEWHDTGNGQTNRCSRQKMIEWINDGNRAYVTDGAHTADVLVVNANPPYIRSHRDGTPTDNLLYLPQF